MKTDAFKAIQLGLCLFFIAAMASGCFFPRGYRDGGPRVGGELIIDGGGDRDHDRGRWHDR